MEINIKYNEYSQKMLEQLDKGVFFSKSDGSVWIDLGDAKMDHKLVLRRDGTSVYMTQDIGTAEHRFQDFGAKRMVYVVADEQNYHFKVLFEIMRRMSASYADGLFHLSYGMIDLTTGKMKSREGTIVDADDLMTEVIEAARVNALEKGGLEGLEEARKRDVYRKIGLAALKFFIIKVNAKKRMIFNPEESVDLQGNTGPYIQYAYVRIQSILKKVNKDILIDKNYQLNDKEKEVLKIIYEFPSVIISSYKDLSPALIANYLYELVKNYNSLYQNHHILNSKTKESTSVRILISIKVSHIIESGSNLLGIDLPNRM